MGSLDHGVVAQPYIDWLRQTGVGSESVLGTIVHVM